MRRLPRRRIAPLIRVRQEVEKRLDPALLRRVEPESLDGLLARDAAGALAREVHDDALRGLFARGSAGRYPLRHLASRSVRDLPAAAELSNSIAEVARGAWSVFGLPMHVSFSMHDWSRHPVTGASAGNEHWSRVSFMHGVGGGDVKLIWEPSRHHHLVRLAQGYFLDRDDTKAESLLVLLDQWLEQNPIGRGINWTSSLEVAFRAIAWCWIWALTCDAAAWTKRRTTRFLVSLWHHARHIERFDSIHHSPNTHLTGEGLGLLYVGLLFPELARSSKWAARGREILESELGSQVLDDGMHFERATGYHRYTAQFYLHFLLLADAFALDVSRESRVRIRAQVTASAALRRPDGTWPVIGDEDSGDTLLLTPTQPQDQGPVLALGGALFRDASEIALTSPADRAAGWWLLDDDSWRFLIDSVARDDRAPSPNAASVALTSAGYYIGRDGAGEDDWWCLVDAGPHGGDRTGHAHTDLGHVEIAHGASHLVVDPGCAGYTIDRAARDQARSERVHACLVTPTEPLAVPRGPFSWERVAPTPSVRHGDVNRLWWCELTYDRDVSQSRLTHRRQVVLVRGQGVIVCDWVIGTAPLTFALHWPLGDAEERPELSGTSLTIRGHSILWSARGGSLETNASIEATRQSPGYGRECTGQLLRLAYSGAAHASVVTCFTGASRRLHVARHDISSVRIGGVVVDAADAGLQLVIAPGESPTIVESGSPATSLGVPR